MTREQNDFDSWADVYDMLYREKYETASDGEFYKGLIDEYGEPALEMACGTGRLYLEMREAGLDVDGVDISAQMVRKLREKAEVRGVDVNVVEADSREVSLDRSYSVVYYPFSSLMHIRGVDAQRDVFQNCYEQLTEGGVFAFDIHTPSFEVVNSYKELEQEYVEFDGVEYCIEGWSELTSVVNQEMELTQRVINLKTSEIEFETTFELTMLPKEQIELLLRDVGFSGWTFYEGFTGEKITDSSDEMVVVAEK